MVAFCQDLMPDPFPPFSHNLKVLFSDSRKYTGSDFSPLDKNWPDLTKVDGKGLVIWLIDTKGKKKQYP